MQEAVNNIPKGYVSFHLDVTDVTGCEADDGRRPGSGAEIGGTCLMLASPAGAYYNGISFIIDGGWLLVSTRLSLQPRRSVGEILT